MVSTDSSSRGNRRSLRHSTEQRERHIDEHDIRRTDSDLQRNTDIRHMYRRKLYRDRDSKSKCHDHRPEHNKLYNSSIQLYTDRHDTGRYYVCMEQPYRR